MAREAAATAKRKLQHLSGFLDAGAFDEHSQEEEEDVKESKVEESEQRGCWSKRRRHRRKNKGAHKPPLLVDICDYESFIVVPAKDTLRFSFPCISAHSTAELFVSSLLIADKDEERNMMYKKKNMSDHVSDCAEMLMDAKLKIMNTRIRYGIDVWTLAAQIVNPYETVSRIAVRVMNRAFFKMWELMQTFPNLVPTIDQNPRLLSAHLCEGPGGFIQALLMHRLHDSAGGKWPLNGLHTNPSSVSDDIKDYHDTWFAITLATPDSKHDALNLQIGKLPSSQWAQGHVHYGKDHSGNITNPDNISSFVEYVLQQTGGKKMHLITADGAFDVSDEYSKQEQNHSHLFFSELVTSLRLQALGGSFVLKLFDCFTGATACIVYILTLLYSNVELVRLRTSRVCSSERFVVAQGYCGVNPSVEKRLMNISANWNEFVKAGSLTANGHFPANFLHALTSSNEVIVREEVNAISWAVDVAEDLGEKLSGSSNRKEIVGILRRKLNTIPKLRFNACSLCQLLGIPSMER